MTVSSTSSDKTFNCDGVSIAFVCPFRVLSSPEMRAFLITTATGVSVELTNGVDFNVTGAGTAANATVTTVATYSAAYQLRCERDTAIVQETDYRDNDPFPAESHELALDRLTMIGQEQEAKIERTLRVPEGEVADELPSAANRALKLVGCDATGRFVMTAPTAGTAAALALTLSSSSLGSEGGGALGFSCAAPVPAATLAAALKDSFMNIMWLVTDQAERAAIQNYTSVTDHTALFQAAAAFGRAVCLSAGRWNINPAVGFKMPPGFKMFGEGLTRSIIKAMANGATLAELIAYTKGSVLKRAFTPGIANSYVSFLDLSDFSVLTTHPSPVDPANYIQLGIDLRSISRSRLTRIYVGNVADAQTGHAMIQSPSAADQTQGYGIIVGTRSSGSVDYCGGEGNRLIDCHVWGVYRNMGEDADLCPLSAANNTVINDPECQGGHSLIFFDLPYAAGVKVNGALIQNCRRNAASALPTSGFTFGGYNGRFNISYAEMGGACDQVAKLLAGSKNNIVDIDSYSYTGASTGTITDASPGNRNKLTYATAVGGVGSGKLVELYSGAPLECQYKGHFVGATETLDHSDGMSITRLGTGDYNIVLATAQPNAHWKVSVECDYDASGHIGAIALSYGTQSTTQLRFFTSSQNGGTTTQLDPRKMLITVKQAKA